MIRNKTRILGLLMLFVVCISLVYQVGAVSYTPAKLRIMIDELDSVVSELSNAELGVQRIEDIIQEANTAHLNQEFDEIPLLIDQVHQLRAKAFAVKNNILKLENAINLAKEDSIDVSEVEAVLEELNLEMKLENYDQCEVLIDEANNLMSVLVREQYQSQISRIESLKELTDNSGLEVIRLDEISDELNNYISNGDIENIILLIDEIDLIEESINSIISINRIILESQDSGLSTLRFKDILAEAESYLKISNFGNIVELGDEAETLYQLALDSKQLISSLSENIETIKSENQNIDLSSTEQLLDEGKREYELENYESSKELLDQSLLELEQAEADALLFGAINTNHAKVRFVNFMRRYWGALIIGVALFVFAGKRWYSEIHIRLLEKKIDKLEQELVFIDKAIKKKQEEYFSKKIISKSEYNTIIDEHQERMLVIREKLPVLKAKLNKRKNTHKILEEV